MRGPGISGMVAGIALAVLIGCAGSPESGTNGQSSTDQVKSISAAFMCNCGECVGMRLDTCYCEYAESAKMYIRQLLAREKYSREEVIAKVNSRYGGLRTPPKKPATR